jgi:hypothetical protein
VETKPENISGVNSRFSRNLNKLHLNLSSWSTEMTSDARPVNPIYNLSDTRKTYNRWSIVYSKQF